jgi:hypothetical protein
MAYLQNFDKDLQKRIDIEQKFADLIYKDFRARRYGLAPCCSIEQMSKYKIKKELCSWSDLKLETYCGIEYGIDSWSIGDPEPDWIDGTCENQCPSIPIFMPNEKQLNNKGGQYYRNYGGINAAIKGPTDDVINLIPNISEQALVTIYCPIVSENFIMSAMLNPLMYGFNGQEDNQWDNTNAPPPNSEPYNVPVAQFYLIPIDSGGTTYQVPHFKYIDPTIINSQYGGVTTVEHPELGTLYYQTNFVDTITGEWIQRLTLFGNTSDNFPAWNLDGGLFYMINEDGGGAPVTLFAEVVDGSNTFHINLDDSFPDGIPNPDIYWAGCDAEILGDFSYQENGTNPVCSQNPPVDIGNSYPWNIPSNPTPKCSFVPYVGTTIWDTTNPGLILNSFQCEYQGFEPTGEVTILNIGACADPAGLNQQWIDININEPLGLGWNTTEYCMWCNESIVVNEFPVDNSLCGCCGGGTNTTTTISPIECATDSEFITFEVTNQDNNPVEGYEIILDGGNLGFTNSLGKFNTTIENASVNTEHNINVCHCFTTTGQCAQTLIKIKVTDCDTEDLTITKADCTPISGS